MCVRREAAPISCMYEDEDVVIVQCHQPSHPYEVAVRGRAVCVAAALGTIAALSPSNPLLPPTSILRTHSSIALLTILHILQDPLRCLSSDSQSVAIPWLALRDASHLHPSSQ